MMENQLQQFIEAVINASDVMMQAMHVSCQEGSSAVSLKLDFIFAIVSKGTPEKDAM